MTSPEISENTPDAPAPEPDMSTTAPAAETQQATVDTPKSADAPDGVEAAEAVAAEVAEAAAVEPEAAEPVVVAAEAAAPAAVEPVPTAPKPGAPKTGAPKPGAPKPGAPKPGAPKPRGPKPSAAHPSPTEVAAHKTHPVKVPVVVDVTPEQLTAALAFGRITEGIASVVDGDDEHAVGPATDETALEPFARAYYELSASIERFHARLTGAELSPKDIDESLASITASLAEPKVIGDLAALRTRVGEVSTEAAAARDALVAERKRARAEALAQRESVVSQAEAIAERPIAQIHWKNDTAALRALLDDWKEAQRSGVRVPKEAERALWKRFTHARTGFEKARKAHFAELDSANSEVAARKEALVAKAETLSKSTDWDSTARSFRDLMNDWRTSGRGRKSVDDALWRRFQAAQDAFFASRREESEAEDAALAGNVEAKAKAVAEAEALLPITDLTTAKSALRAIQDRFEAAGRVPRADAAPFARRMSAVEKAVRDAEDSAWNSRNPEIEARATGAVAQLQSAIADLEAQKAAAKSPKEKASIDEALAARKAWLAQIQGVVS